VQSSAPLPPPVDAIFSIHEAIAAPALTNWQISDITPSDVGRIWSLNESEAAAIGFDWALLESIVIGNEHINYAFNTHFSGNAWTGWGPVRSARYSFDDIELLEFELIEYFTIPLGHVAEWEHRIVGPGRIIPEPDGRCFLSIATAALCIALSRKRWNC
jgi:hypothetical protein